MENLLISNVTTLTGKSFAAAFEDKCYNFYDWFCKDTSLKNKAINLFGRVKAVVKANEKSKMFIFPEGSDVFFKNCCPCYGNQRLYDRFSICDKDGECIISVAPDSPYDAVELMNGATGECIYFYDFKSLCDYIEDSTQFEIEDVKTYGHTIKMAHRKRAAAAA